MRNGSSLVGHQQRFGDHKVHSCSRFVLVGSACQELAHVKELVQVAYFLSNTISPTIRISAFKPSTPDCKAYLVTDAYLTQSTRSSDNTGVLYKTLVVEAVFESKLYGISIKVVELVHVDAVSIVGDNLE